VHAIRQGEAETAVVCTICMIVRPPGKASILADAKPVDLHVSLKVMGCHSGLYLEPRELSHQ